MWSKRGFPVLLLALLSIGWGDPVRDETEKGIDAYDAKSFDEALAAFLRAEEKASNRPVLPFNVGAALYQLKRYQDALSAYDLSKEDPGLSAGSLYGAGNALFRLGKLPEAAELYKQALRRDPSDVDAKHNLELVEKKMNEAKKEEQKKGGEDRERNEEKRKPEQQEEKQPPEQPEEAPPNDSTSPSPEKPKEAETSESRISRDQAERILQALAEEEEQTRRESMKRLRANRKAPAKDW